MPISLVIITLNEESNIRRCIESASFVTEVVVLDSGSTDRTQEIAEELGAKFVIEPWQGYAKQKQRAVDLASHDWVLSLDADEALSEEATASILKEFEKGLDKKIAYEFSRLSFHLGRWIRHGGWYPDRQTRLFNKSSAQWKQSEVHEHILADQKLRLKGDILHYVFRDLAHQVDTNNRYSSLGTEDLLRKGKKYSLFRLLTKPISKFVETYLFKKGFLDGMPGFLIAVSASYSIFLKYAKLYEYQFLQKKPDPVSK